MRAGQDLIQDHIGRIVGIDRDHGFPVDHDFRDLDLGEIERCVLRLAHEQNKGGNLDGIRDRKPQRDAPIVANQTIDSDVREQTSQDVEWRGARSAIDEPCGRNRIRQP